MEKGLSIFYDEEADVLYFSKGKPKENVDSKEIGNDIIVRLNPGTQEVIGFTVLNLTKRFKRGGKAKAIPLEADFVLSV